MNLSIFTPPHPHPFGMLTPGRNWSAGSEYRFGFQGQEKDNEVKGTGNSINFTYRVHDPRIGRFLSIDPLTAKYPFYSPYAFSGNRVIDAIELEGREYIIVHHYLNGTVAITEIYKMTEEDVKRLGGTQASLYNSAAYGPNGKGIEHRWYNDKGEHYKSNFEQPQGSLADKFRYHGLYSGPGSITKDGMEGSRNYDFNRTPIDWADAIAKRHDEDYEKATAEGPQYMGYVDDIRTLQADYDMLKRLNDVQIMGHDNNGVKGVDTPVRTSYSMEMGGTISDQKFAIGALTEYKQWKVDMGYTNLSKEGPHTWEKLKGEYQNANPVGYGKILVIK